MTKKNTARNGRDSRPSEPGLDSRYGEIGISAVAAALRYQTTSRRTTDDAPAPAQVDRWLADAAA